MTGAFRTLCLATVVLAFGIGEAQAQETAQHGDWRYVGDDPQTAFGWDFASLSRAGDLATVRLLQIPLRPTTFDHAIATVTFNCRSGQYTLSRYSTFGADGALTFTDEVSEPWVASAGPTSVVLPLACEGDPRLVAQPPSTALEFSQEARSYVVSGAAEWERNGRPSQ